MKKILYVDMDNVLVDFYSGIAQLDEKPSETTMAAWTTSPEYLL
jgi:hypothetical protein